MILYAMTTYSLPFKRAELLSTDDLELNIPNCISDGNIYSIFYFYFCFMGSCEIFPHNNNKPRQ